MKKRKNLLVVLFLILASVLLLLSFNHLKGNNEEKNNFIKNGKEKILIKDVSKNQPVLGKNDAPVTIIEFGDYVCDGCQDFNRQVYPQIKKDYISSGKVKFIYINHPVNGDVSVAVSKAQEEILKYYPNKFWQIHEGLFKAGQEGDILGNWLTPEYLEDFYVKNGIPRKAAQAILVKINNDKKHLPLNEDLNLAKQLKINQAPTIFVNGKKINQVFNYNEIKKAIENAN